MSDSKLNIDEQFDAGILDVRRATIEKMEHLARRAGSYKSRSVGKWKGTIPISIVTTVDAVRAASSESSRGASDIFSGNREQIGAALERSSVSVEHLQSDNLETVITALNKATGAAFELEVQRMFQAGELAVPPGTAKIELASFTNAGSDFRFIDSDDRVIGLMNTKASLGHDVIAEHFARYPEVNYVFVTDEAANAAAEAGYTVVDGLSDSLPATNDAVVVRTGISAQEFRDSFEQFVTDGDTGLSSWLDGGWVIDNLPIFTIGFLAYRFRKRHQQGLSRAEIKSATTRDAVSSGTAYGVAIGLQAVGVPIPVTIVGSMFSAASVNGLFQVRDEWGDLASNEDLLTSRLEQLA